MKALDKAFVPLAEIDTYTSLILHTKYYSCGDFELHINSVIPGIRYCYIDEFDGDNVGIVEHMAVHDNTVIYSGRLLKQLLGDKVIYKTKAFYNKTPEQIVKALVTEFYVGKIETEKIKGLGSPITIQVTGDNLLDFCDTILETQDLGCEVVYDYINDKVVFRVFKGEDKTMFAPFAKNFENINGFSYNYNTSNVKNFAFVAGEVKEGQSRTIITVDLRNDDNEEKKEIWVDARDLQSEFQEDGQRVTISSAEYKEMLRQRGIKKLNEYKISETCNIIPNTKDLSLGELRYFKDEKSGVESVQRVTEIIYAKENNIVKKDVVWGKQNTIRRII